MSFRNDEEQRGYDNYKQPGYDRYDGGYDYEQGWNEHAREERRERERQDERRAEEEAEQRHHERRVAELAQERHQQEEAEYEQYAEEQRWREASDPTLGAGSVPSGNEQQSAAPGKPESVSNISCVSTPSEAEQTC